MTKPVKLPEDSSRVTMRAIAATAGVSVQAVSLALRNHPTVGRETRARIQTLARELGYTPDLHLVKLMHHLRANRQRKTTASVCALTSRAPTAKEVFCDLLLEGANAAAPAAGFSIEVMHIDPAKMARNRLQRILRTRGFDGLLLLPMTDLHELDDLLDWRDFSIVSATLSVLSPQFDRVVADHFRNVFNLCSRLRQAGYRRPGLVVRTHHDKRCGHRLTAAHAWQGIYGGVEPVPAYRCEQEERAAFRRWLVAERPDAIIVEQDQVALTVRQEIGLTAKLPIFSCSVRPADNGTFPFAGNYDKPREIGAVAVETLARKISMGQRGMPENPHTTLIPGVWVDGPAALSRS